jgi:hypothetical protein
MRVSTSAERRAPARRRRPSAGIRTAPLGAALAALGPAVATACPVCFGATSERVLHSYYATAAALTLLPLMLVGGFLAWLLRQGRESAGAADRDDAGEGFGDSVGDDRGVRP